MFTACPSALSCIRPVVLNLFCVPHAPTTEYLLIPLSKDSPTQSCTLNNMGCYAMKHCIIITGSIAHRASLPVFSLLRGRFWAFSPRRGDTLHRWGPILHAKFHPHRCNDKGVGPPKLKFLLRFDQNVEYKWRNAPQGRIPCAIFTKFAELVPHFRMR